jgi:alkylated DNA repair protein (DNA oxidative demethylase)
MAADPDTPLDLFVDGYAQPRRETLGPGAMLLRAFASPRAAALVAALEEVVQRSPFRFMTTPGGYRMSVAMTNCGAAGWVTDRSGYRYDALDPLSGACWPEMPPVFRELAVEAAGAAGFAKFGPDACLINRYVPGARLSLHQDKMNGTLTPRSFPYHSGCRRYSCSAVTAGPSARGESRWAMRT